VTQPETVESVRPLLLSIAYRMLGGVSDAEDIVQEALLRYHRELEAGTEIRSPKAYLSAVVTRLAIDHLRSAQVRRETYVGEWIPEPMLTDDDAHDVLAGVERRESISLAFLLLLERLNPVERAVFLLHDVFAYDYDEIARIVDKSEANCRQLAARARRHIQAGRPRFDASRQARDELASRFFAAVTGGDLEGLVEVLAADVVVYGDGGGKVPQWAAPITGSERVARLFAGLGGRMREVGVRFELREVNGQPGALVRDRAGQITNVLALDIRDGLVQTIRSVINPDKLRHLGPVADVRALLREPRPPFP